nr:histone lysine demethylase PHF8-like [Columba livia]
MGLYWSILFAMGSYGFRLVPVGSYWFTWVYTGPYCFLWVPMDSGWCLWVHTGLRGSVLVHTGLYWCSCVGVEEEAAADIDLFHCPTCAVLRGPSVLKRRRGPPKEAEPTRPARTGSAHFIRELRGRTFPSAEEILLRPSGSQLTVEYLEEKTFSVPILVNKKDGLGMTLPPPSFTPRDVQHYVGGDKVIEVIDVGRQAGCRMTLGEFVTYLGGTRRDRVLNVISLEFSDTRWGSQYGPVWTGDPPGVTGLPQPGDPPLEPVSPPQDQWPPLCPLCPQRPSQYKPVQTSKDQ